ncbi:MAG: hypothetical protein ACPG7U_01690 [Holosporaceae bacterium]
MVTPNEGFYKVPNPNNNLQVCTNGETQIGVDTQGKFGSIFLGPAQGDGGLTPNATNETALATRVPCEQINVFAPVDYNAPTSADETALAIYWPSQTNNNL